jgi:predicted permease
MILTETLLQDLRYAARMLRRNLGFSAVAVLALGLGIGVNTAVFTAYKAMVARPLDARRPSELVNLGLIRNSAADAPDPAFSYPDYQSYRDSAHSFSGVIAYSPEHMTLTDAGSAIGQRDAVAGSLAGKLGLLPHGAGHAELASVFVVSENYFQVLGVAPFRGLGFESIGAQTLVASPSVLISENYWRERFGSDSAVLGRTIRLNGAAVTVVGITPRGFTGTNIFTPDFWLPISLEPLMHGDPNWLHDRENRRYRLFARLAPGVSARQAQAEMTLLTDHLRGLHDPQSEAAKPATAMVWPGSPWPIPVRFYGLMVPILLIMLAAAMILIVACANVGSLQLARARSRQNELRTRLSLGASRGRVIRQLLTESSALAVIAGAVALPFTWVVLQIGVSLLGRAFPAQYGSLIFEVTPDAATFAYVFLISLISGVLFGLAPALESSRSALSLSERSSTSPAESRRVQGVLIAAQVAFSLVLMIAGSLLIHSAIHSLKIDPGYDSGRVVALEFRFPEGSTYSHARQLAVVRELRARVAALPGVASVTSGRPPADDAYVTSALPLDSEKLNQRAIRYTYIQSNYFETLGIPLFLGHGFESKGGQPAYQAVLSESAARALWPGQNPVGRGLRLSATPDEVVRPSARIEGPVYRVIGVVGDTRGAEFDGSDAPRVYLPLADDRLADRPILIRTLSNPAPVIKAIDPLVSSTEPDLVASTSTLEETLRRSAPFIASSFAAAIAIPLGLLGLLLATMGIYGTVSYVVLLRTREVGIRMAIGAQKRDVLALILGESTRPVMAGLLAGMILAVGASELLRGVLYGLDAVDAVSFAGVALLFLLIALVAAYPPARRAMRVDPAVALRYE